MKLVSWNVNGVRAAYTKGFNEYFKEVDADIFCIQETKMQEGQLDLEKEGYFVYLNSAERKGYSGVAVWTKKKPISVEKGMGIEEHDKEGRILKLEFDDFYLITVYTPNSKAELARLPYRVEWEKAFREYLQKNRKVKPIIVCGDLNVAHKEIDVKNHKTNKRSAGFTIEEREEFTNLIELGYIDTFRYFYPDEEKFTWWSYFGKAREKNVGWRIDYFVVSDELKSRLKDAQIHDKVFGSDHCPVVLQLN